MMKIDRLRKALRDFFFGMLIMDPFMTARRARLKHDLFLMDMLFSDMLGVSINSCIYKLNILPYFLPQIDKWKYLRVKEHDVTDKVRGL